MQSFIMEVVRSGCQEGGALRVFWQEQYWQLAVDVQHAHARGRLVFFLKFIRMSVRKVLRWECVEGGETRKTMCKHSNMT